MGSTRLMSSVPLSQITIKAKRVKYVTWSARFVFCFMVVNGCIVAEDDESTCLIMSCAMFKQRLRCVMTKSIMPMSYNCVKCGGALCLLLRQLCVFYVRAPVV